MVWFYPPKLALVNVWNANLSLAKYSRVTRKRGTEFRLFHLLALLLNCHSLSNLPFLLIYNRYNMFNEEHWDRKQNYLEKYIVQNKSSEWIFKPCIKNVLKYNFIFPKSHFLFRAYSSEVKRRTLCKFSTNLVSLLKHVTSECSHPRFLPELWLSCDTLTLLWICPFDHFFPFCFFRPLTFGFHCCPLWNYHC